eukprot:1720072-Pyramimonas_sp.AAC.1
MGSAWSFGSILRAFWVPLGGAYWGLLGTSSGREASWAVLGPLGRLWGRLGPSWSHLGPSWMLLGCGLGGIFDPLGELGGHLGRLGGHIGDIRLEQETPWQP